MSPRSASVRFIILTTMKFQLFLLLAILPAALCCGRPRWSDSALQYNAYNHSKIHLSPMVTLVNTEESFSVCSWVNKMREGADNFWIFYGTSSYPVFHISDDLQTVGVFNSSMTINSEPEIQLNTWSVLLIYYLFIT